MPDRIRTYEYGQLLHAVRGEAVHSLIEQVILARPDLIELAYHHPAACEEQLYQQLQHLSAVWSTLQHEPVLTRWIVRAVQEVLRWVAERKPTALHAERKLPEIRYGQRQSWAITPKRLDIDFLRPDGVKFIVEVKTGRAGNSDLMRKMQRYALAYLVAEAERNVHHRKVALRVLHLQHPTGAAGHILKVRRYTVTHGWARRWLARRQAVAKLPKEPWLEEIPLVA